MFYATVTETTIQTLKVCLNLPKILLSSAEKSKQPKMAFKMCQRKVLYIPIAFYTPFPLTSSHLCKCNTHKISLLISSYNLMQKCSWHFPQKESGGETKTQTELNIFASSFLWHQKLVKRRQEQVLADISAIVEVHILEDHWPCQKTKTLKLDFGACLHTEEWTLINTFQWQK